MNKQESGYRWVVFGTIILAYFVILCQRTGPGLITDQLMRDFHVSASTIGLVSSVQFLAYSGLQIPVGLVSGRYGPNLFLILGALLVGIGDLLFSLAPNEYILITSRFLTGIGDSLIFINFVLILNQWFKSKEYGVKPPFIMVIVSLFIIGFGMGASSLTFAVVRQSFPVDVVGLATGFANMGGFLSAVLLPIVFGSVLDLFPQQLISVGYHYGFIITTLFSLMGLLGVIMFKEEIKERKTVLNAS